MSNKIVNHDFLNHSGEYPVPVPPAEEAWHDMSSRLEKEKKTRIAWWLFFSLLLLCTVAGFYTKNILFPFTDNEAIKATKQDKQTTTSGDTETNQARLQTQLQAQISPVDSSFTEHVKTKEKTSTGNQTVAANSLSKRSKNGSLSNDPDKSKMDEKEEASSQTSSFDGLPDDDKATTSEKTEKDTAHAKASKENEEDITVEPKKPKPLVEAGVDWSFPLPFNKTGAYFLNPQGKSQPLYMLIPGAWVHFVSGRSRFSLSVRPYSSRLLPHQPFNAYLQTSVSGDTIKYINHRQTINKVYGVSASLGYQHNINGNWWLGGTLESNWWNKAIFTTQDHIERKSFNGSFPTQVTDSSGTAKLSDSQWDRFSKWQAAVNAELFYRSHNFQYGVRTGLAITPFAKDKGPTNYLYSEIFLRLKLVSYRPSK